MLLRDIMQDDARQSPKATRLIESLTADEPGFVALVSVIELVWVLGAAYGRSREDQARAIEALLGTAELRVERSDLVLKALRNFERSKADFADCLIERSAAAAGCNATVTFDVQAAKTAGMALLS